MENNTLNHAFKVVQDFGAELENKKSAIEYMLFGAKFPESKLPYTKEVILESSRIVASEIGESQPEILAVLEHTPSLLYGYTSDENAREFLRQTIKRLALSDEEIDELFDIYIKK